MSQNNLENPQVAYSEMKVKALIIDIEKKLDKNQKDYWIIYTKAGNYFAFGPDYHLVPKALSLLMNYPHHLVNSWAVLTVKKNKDREKVIMIEMEKQT